MQGIVFPVSLMTVLGVESKLPKWSATNIKFDDIAIVTVDDRTVEVPLMENDPGTCLQAFDHESLYLSLVAYIYVPSCVSNVHVMLHISGLACTDQGVIVYHQLSTMEHHDLQFQECIPIMTGSESGHSVPCKFVCDKMWSEAAITKVGIRIDKMPWNMMDSVKVCGLNVTN